MKRAKSFLIVFTAILVGILPALSWPAFLWLIAGVFAASSAFFLWQLLKLYAGFRAFERVTAAEFRRLFSRRSLRIVGRR